MFNAEAIPHQVRSVKIIARFMIKDYLAMLLVKKHKISRVTLPSQLKKPSSHQVRRVKVLARFMTKDYIAMPLVKERISLVVSCHNSLPCAPFLLRHVKSLLIFDSRAKSG
ncbi:hypothetical protein CDAR_33941 [Caerostris darwini]|uniref:Uncharacterized protein n=1 Tax=Caerostris darwini TaxID=1538125 RepID=A0AAV4UYI2_9ARAC|nr:hypothetical protein CDAR_33941 [Caerostris darwini]